MKSTTSLCSTSDHICPREAGKVFSTDPDKALGQEGNTYFVKGCNAPTAFKEVVGCSLAAICLVKVPPADFCIFGEETYAGVEEVAGAQRNILPWLKNPARINNHDDFFRIIAVDTWRVNSDRNMGNVVGSAKGNGSIDL